MNLNQIVIDKINELGLAAAAVYFGRSQVTIRSWKNTGKAPADAAQKVFDEQQSTAGTMGQPSGLPDQGAPLGITIPEAKPAGTLEERVAMLELRTSRLEFTVNSPTHTAVVPPQKQPNWTDPHHFGNK